MKHRIINTKFWHDEYVQNLSIQKRYLYLYLFTNPHTEISGIYEISLKTMEFETLIDSDSLSQSLQEFENDKKLLYCNNWIILKNFVKHQRPNPSIIKGLKNAISELPVKIYQKAQQIGIFDDSLSQSVDSLSHTPLYKVKESKVKESKHIAAAAAENESFNGSVEIEKWLNDKQRHIQIVGLWGTLEKPKLDNKDQFKNFTNRNIRIAKELSGYSNERIKRTRQMLRDKGLNYTLETIAKHIDSIKEPKKDQDYQLIDGKMHPIYGK